MSIVILGYMSIGATFQFYRLCSLQRTFLAFAVCFFLGSSYSACSEETSSVISEIVGEETVIIRANEGIRPVSKNFLVLQGDVVFLSADWKITGEKMKISGPLQEPDKISVEGSRATIERIAAAKKSFLAASGRKIELDSIKNEILLEGNALLKTNEQTLSGVSLIYFYDTGKIISGGTKGRVRFRSER